MQCKLNNRQLCNSDKGLHNVIEHYTKILVFSVEFSECYDGIVENNLMLTLRHFDCMKALSITVLIKGHLSTTTTDKTWLRYMLLFSGLGPEGQEKDLEMTATNSKCLD